jgi:hypothetical protein
MELYRSKGKDCAQSKVRVNASPAMLAPSHGRMMSLVIIVDILE